MTDNTAAREDSAAEESLPAVSLERPARHIRRPFFHKNAGLILLCLAALAGTALGAVAAPTNVSCALTRTGDFWECFAARLICSGSVLILEYITGFFAAGGMIVWLAPLFSGLGAGLSLACVFCADPFESLWLIPIAAAYPLLTAFAAKTSADFSELIANFITCKKSSIIMSDSAARGYTLSFIVYMMILLAFSAAEAALKL